MQVEYKQRVAYGDGVEISREPISYWLNAGLKQGHIESRIKKLCDLMSLIGAQWVSEHPQSISDVAEIVECEGYDHKITNDEPYRCER